MKKRKSILDIPPRGSIHRVKNQTRFKMFLEKNIHKHRIFRFFTELLFGYQCRDCDKVIYWGIDCQDCYRKSWENTFKHSNTWHDQWGYFTRKKQK